MHATPSASALVRDMFGDIDIYLFDQLVRGRFDRRRRILDAGCGGGRNLPFFLMNGFDVWAVDRDAHAVAQVQHLAATLNPDLPSNRIQSATLDALPLADESVDAVICSAVLHFARDMRDFTSMVQEMWRTLAPGGLFFARLASSIGIESLVADTVGRVRLPDGSDRFIVDEETLMRLTSELGGVLSDPLKTTNVQNQRCMTTWVIEKP
ncbi:MAG: class I SAM-dependent methyltransferase [Vicinamibacterales bacterium]